MSQPHGPAGPDTQPQQRQPSRPLQRLLDALGVSDALAQQPPSGGSERIISPVSVERLLELLMETTVEQTEDQETKTVRARVSQLTLLVQRLARMFINVYLTDGLGRIYHPLYSVPTVESRLATLAQLLSKTISEISADIAAMAENHTVTPQEYEEYVREAELTIQLSFLILAEVYNQLMTMYYINAPPELRPPLVNAALGYEILSQGQKKKWRFF